jgi:cation transport ATPase
MNIFNITLPTFGLSMDVIMLILSTPVVFYCGWMFLSGSYYSLRQRTLNMNELVCSPPISAASSLWLLARRRFLRQRPCW